MAEFVSGQSGPELEIGVSLDGPYVVANLPEFRNWLGEELRPGIKPLFRRMDRESMSFVFDLWSYGDVRTHAPEILRRLDNGTMPCDGAWPKDKVEVFRRWLDSGMVES